MKSTKLTSRIPCWIQGVICLWPTSYWGIEPLDEERPDWQLRYASVFQIGKVPSGSVAQTARDAGTQEAGPEVLIAVDAR